MPFKLKNIYEASERDFRVVLVKGAMSQLYPKGEEEMQNIGVKLLKTNDIENVLARHDQFIGAAEIGARSSLCFFCR